MTNNVKPTQIIRAKKTEGNPLVYLLNTFWTNRKIFYRVILSEIRKQYAGSYLGIIWIFLFPILFMSVYSLAFISILKTQSANQPVEQLVLVIFSGLMPFIAFSESFSRAAGAFISHKSLIKSATFNIELMPVIEVLLGQITGLVGMLLLLFCGIIFGYVSIKCLLFFPFWLMYTLFLVGLSWIIATIGLFVRDIQRIIPSIILIMMMISPIGYITRFLPVELKFINYFNPLSYYIHSFQGIIIQSVDLEFSQLIISCCISILLFLLGAISIVTFKKSMLNAL